MARTRQRTDPRLQVSVSCHTPAPVRVPGLAPWLVRAAPRSARGLVNIALVTDRSIRRLNRTYREADYATDVLSFSSDAFPFLGDIAIAVGVAKRQAREAGHAFAIEVRVLALHGLLHLLGLDHESDGGEMARAEARLRRRSGLPEGLLERAGARKPAVARRRR